MRARYTRQYYQRDWYDPVNYHMVLNTEALGIRRDGRGDRRGGARTLGW